MKNLPPLKSLNVFLSAAKNESFKAAAEQLYVTQAAVSQQIRLLEAHLGCQLFDRNSKQTRLNEKGLLLMPYIEQAFEQINHGVNAVSSEPNANELRITALHSVTSAILIPKISLFQDLNPKLSVQFCPNNKLDNFDSLDMDIAIRRGLGNYPGLESRKLIDDSIIMVVSPLLLSGEIDSERVFKLPLLEDTSSDIKEVISACCAQYHIKTNQLKSKLKTTDALPIIQSAIAGQGFTFVSKVLVDEHIKNGHLINPLNYTFDSPRTLYLVAPPHHFKWDKVKRFEAWIMALLGTK